jgi:hypothetical protein
MYVQPHITYLASPRLPNTRECLFATSYERSDISISHSSRGLASSDTRHDVPWSWTPCSSYRRIEFSSYERQLPSRQITVHITYQLGTWETSPDNTSHLAEHRVATECKSYKSGDISVQSSQRLIPNSSV